MAVYNLPNYTNDQGFGLPLNIRRGNPNPLDNSAVWASLDAAKNYAKNDPTAYVGQIISVVDNANSVVDVYKINDTAGNLVLVGTVTLGDDRSIVKNDDDTLSLYDFGKKYYKFVAAEGDVAAHYEAVEGWKDGLEPKVHDGVLAWYEPNPTTVDGLQSSINNLQAEVDTNKENIKANTDAIAVLNGDKTTEGSVAYQIAAVVAGADADFDTLKEIADWIAAHPDSVATINAAIKGNTDAIADLKELVGTDAVADQISAAIEELNITQYATVADLEDAKDDIAANADAIEALQDLVGEGTVDERITDAVKETVDGVKQDKFALRVHGHTVSDVDGLGATLDTLAAKDTVNGIDLRVKAIEDGLDTTIDAAIQTHVAAADAKYETIENVAQLSSNIDVKVAALEKADTDNLAEAKTHAETKIAELNIAQYAKQADLDNAVQAIGDIKDHATVDSFADVMAEVAKKQDIIPENTYDVHGAAAAVDNKLEAYKTEANGRLAALEAVDNATQAEMDAAVDTLEAADAAILAKIGTVADGDTVAGLVGAAQTAADNAQAAAEAAQGDVDALEILVGAVPEGSDTVIAYVNKKAQEVLDAATGGSSESAASVKLALDNYKTENDPKVEANATAAANAQAKADEAYTLAGTKATMDEVNDAIANAGHAVAEEVNAAIDGINKKIGDVTDDKTVVEMIEEAQATATYDDEEVRGLIDTNADVIAKEIEDREGAVSGLKTELEGKINTKVEQDAYDTKVGALEDEDERLAGLIGDNADAINGLNTTVGTLVGEDNGKSVRTIANEELAAQLIAENAAEALDSLHEIATWIQSHPGEAATMNAAIEALQAKVDTGDATVSAYVTAAINALNIGDYATVVALDAAVERIVALEGASATHATKTELQGVSDALDQYKTAHNGDYTNAQVDALVEGVQDQIDALDDTYATDAELEAAIAAEVERANGAYAAKTLESTVDTHVNNGDVHVTTDDKAKWNGAEKNAKDHSDANLETAKAYADQVELDAIAAAKTETESQVAAEAAIARAAEQANATAISNEATAREQAVAGVQGALDTYKTSNDTAVAGKADKATTLAGYGITDAMTADDIIALFQWSEF